MTNDFLKHIYRIIHSSILEIPRLFQKFKPIQGYKQFHIKQSVIHFYYLLNDRNVPL